MNVRPRWASVVLLAGVAAGCSPTPSTPPSVECEWVSADTSTVWCGDRRTFEPFCDVFGVPEAERSTFVPRLGCANHATQPEIPEGESRAYCGVDPIYFDATVVRCVPRGTDAGATDVR